MHENPHESPDESNLLSEKFIKDIEGMCLTSKNYIISYTTNIGAFDGEVTVLSVNNSGLIYHCNQYGVTLIIPEGAVQQSGTVWFKACLFSDKFKFGDYIPVTPIVWVYTDMKLIKPAELYLPHHIYIEQPETKSELVLLTADDKFDGDKLLFFVNNKHKMEVESTLCKTYCHHFCSSCVAVDEALYNGFQKHYMLAVAKKQKNDTTLLMHFCIFPLQLKCKKVL